MDIINQPHNKDSVGKKLQEILNNPTRQFDIFYIVSAYVKKSGVQQLAEGIKNFRSLGGIVKAVVGIDQKNTSLQGLKLLLPLCDQIYVYHSDSPMQTFHPKAYSFERNNKAILLIGSNNLTSGGLFSNYELSSHYEYDLTDDKEKKSYQDFKNAFEFYSTPSQCSKLLSTELLEKLSSDGRYLSDEEAEVKRIISQIGKSAPRERIFGTETFRAPRLQQQTKPKKKKVEEITELEEIERESVPVTKGKSLWEKVMTNTDALVTQSGTNPTGSFRFTQAGWEHEGKRIDQTKYFRDVLFGDLHWEPDEDEPHKEVTSALFNITILGNDIGSHVLTLRHNPQLEAGQKNFTTALSWGEVTKFITENNLSGKTLRLYAPEEGEKEPFFIEIY